MRLEFEKRKRSRTDKDSVTSGTKNCKDSSGDSYLEERLIMPEPSPSPVVFNPPVSRHPIQEKTHRRHQARREGKTSLRSRLRAYRDDPWSCEAETGRDPRRRLESTSRRSRLGRRNRQGLG